MSNTPNDVNEEFENLDFKQSWKISKWAFLLNFEFFPFAQTVNTVTSFVQEIKIIGRTYLGARALDILVSTVQKEGTSIRDLYPILAMMLAYEVFELLISYVGTLSESYMRIHRNYKMDVKFRDKLHQLDIQTLESPRMSNSIHLARNYMNEIFRFNSLIIDFLSSFLGVVTYFIIVVKISFSYPIIFLAVSIPYYFVNKKYAQKSYRHHSKNSEKMRRSYSFASWLNNVSDLREVRVSQFKNYLSDLDMQLRNTYNKEHWDITKVGRSWGHFFTLLRRFVKFYGYYLLFSFYLAAKITIGQITFFISSIEGFQGSVTNVLGTINAIVEDVVLFQQTYKFFNTEPGLKNGEKVMPKFDFGPEIKFENLTFAYPNNLKTAVIKNLNLTINPGEKIAIVGHNGAGKTTLVKLLCRFYLPTEGEIKINGYDIKDIENNSLYENMGVLFQEYNTYPSLNVEQNIYAGDTSRKINKTKIRLAAQSADAVDFIKEYKNGFDQILSESYKNGIKPSTGQWQKIAIARFFYRDAPLVIFDEPTASIDAVSEYNIFNNIYEFFKQKTVIIISHRFSTVRNADRILVVDHGEIIEQGTHQELLALNGKYAKAFRLQAQGYNN